MAINIPLYDNWRLMSDAHNFIIAREDGGRIFFEGFYSDIDSAIRGFISMKIKGFDSTSLLALNNSIKALEIAFCRAIHTLKLEEEKKHG
jgi:hypothetical protein